MSEWTDEKNRRRGVLIDKNIEGSITEDESFELGYLNAECEAYVEEVSPNRYPSFDKQAEETRK